MQRLARVQGAVRLPGELDLRTRAWFNENLESRNFYVPGVIVIVVSLVALLLTSMSVVREKEIGTMEQILVTPITPGELILGKTLPFALIGLVDVTVVAAVGAFWFEVPIRGNIALLYLATGLYLMTMLGMGLLISTVSRTQQQAMMTTFFYFFPAMLLSGFAFPIAAMPTVVQWLTLLDPLRYFLVVIRGIFLKGVGLDILWPELATLAVMGVLTLWLATRRFHKTLSRRRKGAGARGRRDHAACGFAAFSHTTSTSTEIPLKLHYIDQSEHLNSFPTLTPEDPFDATCTTSRVCGLSAVDCRSSRLGGGQESKAPGNPTPPAKARRRDTHAGGRKPATAAIKDAKRTTRTTDRRPGTAGKARARRSPTWRSPRPAQAGAEEAARP